MRGMRIWEHEIAECSGSVRRSHPQGAVAGAAGRPGRLPYETKSAALLDSYGLRIEDIRCNLAQ